MIEHIISNKTSIIILTLYKNSITSMNDITRYMNITYSHLQKIITNLEKNNLLFLNRKGRVARPELTNRGLEIAAILDDLDKTMDKVTQP